MQKYGSALRRGRNVIGMVSGGVRRRPGLLDVGETYHGIDRLAVVLPFTFSLSQSFVLELTHGRLRVIYKGGYVVEDEVLVTAATRANPLVVTIPCHNYQPGDDIVFENITGMVELNQRGPFRVTAIGGPPGAETVTFGGVDSTAWGVFTGSGGGADFCAVPPAPPPAPPPPGDPYDPPPPYPPREPDPPTRPPVAAGILP